MTTITTAIYNKYYDLYQSPNFSNETLKGFVEELEAQNEIALDHYCMFEQDEKYELAERAWEVYNTVRMYNHEVIKAINAIIEERSRKGVC